MPRMSRMRTFLPLLSSATRAHRRARSRAVGRLTVVANWVAALFNGPPSAGKASTGKVIVVQVARMAMAFDVVHLQAGDTTSPISTDNKLRKTREAGRQAPPHRS